MSRNLVFIQEKIPKFILVILFISSGIFLLLPFAIAFFTFWIIQGQIFNILWSSIAPLLIGFYLLRIALWNGYGKELIKLENQNVTYQADYKIFKSKKLCFKLEDLNIELIPSKKQRNTSHLLIRSQERHVQTSISMSSETLLAFRDLVLKAKKN